MVVNKIKIEIKIHKLSRMTASLSNAHLRQIYPNAPLSKACKTSPLLLVIDPCSVCTKETLDKNKQNIIIQ